MTMLNVTASLPVTTKGLIYLHESVVQGHVSECDPSPLEKFFNSYGKYVYVYVSFIEGVRIKQVCASHRRRKIGNKMCTIIMHLINSLYSSSADLQ